MKVVLTIIRWIVGLLFIFSGLIKANDPLGLSYKMQEFFEVWGWDAFHNYTLFFSIVMNVFEVLAGVAIIIGWRIRLFTWLLLLLIIFFTFLTGYALLSGKIKTCGCFGDCLPLSPLQSFMKDIFLLVLILVLVFKQKAIGTLPSSSALAGLVLTVVATGGLQWYVLQYLPIVDCLPYKKGNNLVKQMEVPAGAVIDSFAITFRYKKAGKEVEFDANNIPADLDSTYEYVDRYDKLIRKGNAVAPIEDFKLSSESGTDTTNAILQQPVPYVLVMAQNFDNWGKASVVFDQLLAEARTWNMPVIVATPLPDAAAKLFDKNKVTIVGLDATVLKTAARVVPTFFLMKRADILDKKSYKSGNSFLESMRKTHL
ncbi:Uncharacterized membrane protein YphA, DoxX/SURF4 family [Filimonas lacunae]|uniref:Uncharacterized membrane protein YphA, DoxX/SURF4 family n=1 Tax=Filimonas lacunae TaxID=477680 RepID=A0A173MKG4_9BACT|nr:BT_3928 family protein [Filimonas lacunae]BAV08094.1 hypothetical protein FLA_4127 [Filimonas lacunae]SIT09241.1 Uncharacterized membrane protein YphA, DoxX/SURF4 family [Filimonas lacunae]